MSLNLIQICWGDSNALLYVGGRGDSQAFPKSIDQGLEQGLVVWDGLQDVAISRNVADGPLAQPGAAEAEDVAGEMEEVGRTVSSLRPRYAYINRCEKRHGSCEPTCQVCG